jgi:hypothetical protein
LIVSHAAAALKEAGAERGKVNHWQSIHLFINSNNDNDREAIWCSGKLFK